MWPPCLTASTSSALRCPPPPELIWAAALPFPSIEWLVRSRRHRVHAGNPSASLLEMEQEILRALCVASHPVLFRSGMIRKLVPHEWRSEEHRLVFELLGRFSAADANFLREQLPAAATRMGFPDIDWQLYFAAQDFSIEDLERLAAAILREEPPARDTPGSGRSAPPKS